MLLRRVYIYINNRIINFFVSGSKDVKINFVFLKQIRIIFNILPNAKRYFMIY